MSIKKGIYKIKITGENLSKVNSDVDVASKKSELFRLDNIIHTDKEISYEFNLKRKTDNVEFRFFNNTKYEIIILK